MKNLSKSFIGFLILFFSISHAQKKPTKGDLAVEKFRKENPIHHIKSPFFFIVFFSFLLIYAFFVFFSFTIHLLDFCVVYLHY